MNLVITTGRYLPAGRERALQLDRAAQYIARTNHVRVVTHLTEPDEEGIPGLVAWNVTVPHDIGRVEVETLTPGRYAWRLLPFAGRWQSVWIYDRVYGRVLRQHLRGADLIYAVESEGALLGRLAARVAAELGLPFLRQTAAEQTPEPEQLMGRLMTLPLNTPAAP